jgi:predicted transcriptional regulator
MMVGMELDQIGWLLATQKKLGSGVTAKQIREAAGVTQVDLAARIGVTQPALSRMEAGTRTPRQETLRRWVEALSEIEKQTRRASRAHRPAA